MNDLIKLERERFQWSLSMFPKATALSSLKKCESEIEEIRVDILTGNSNAEEYADALMCLFDSAGRSGISPEKIMEAYSLKFEKNKKREWVLNDDNTYSHKK